MSPCGWRKPDPQVSTAMPKYPMTRSRAFSLLPLPAFVVGLPGQARAQDASRLAGGR